MFTCISTFIYIIILHVQTCKKIECTKEEVRILKSIANSRSAELRQIERCKIILECLKDKENQQIANELGFSTPTVIKWRNRYANKGMVGLTDAPRRGAPTKYDKFFEIKYFLWLKKNHPNAKGNDVVTDGLEKYLVDKLGL